MLTGILAPEFVPHASGELSQVVIVRPLEPLEDLCRSMTSIGWSLVFSKSADEKGPTLELAEDPPLKFFTPVKGLV
jgi:hypothetical protein